MSISRGEKTRTSDLHVPNVARCQLCYTPGKENQLVIFIASAKLSLFPKISKKNFCSRLKTPSLPATFSILETRNERLHPLNIHLTKNTHHHGTHRRTHITLLDWNHLNGIHRIIGWDANQSLLHPQSPPQSHRRAPSPACEREQQVKRTIFIGVPAIYRESAYCEERRNV